MQCDIVCFSWYFTITSIHACIRKCIGLAVNGTPSHSYGVSLAIWDHTVLPATRHKWTHPALTPAIQAGTRFTYPGGMEGWVDLVDLIAPRPGVEPATFRSRVQRSTNATTKTTSDATVCIIQLYNIIAIYRPIHVYCISTLVLNVCRARFLSAGNKFCMNTICCILYVNSLSLCL